MKKLIWFIGGIAAAAAGFLVWQSTQPPNLQEPAYYLDENTSEDPSQDPTFV